MLAYMVHGCMVLRFAARGLVFHYLSSLKVFSGLFSSQEAGVTYSLLPLNNCEPTSRDEIIEGKLSERKRATGGRSELFFFNIFIL